MSADRYGTFYWCVKTPLSSSGDVYLNADGVAIRDGCLVFTSRGEHGINVVFGPGEWAALDAAAIQAGHAPLAPEVWECVLPESGEVVSIVRDEAEAHRVCRECRVFTLDEIARLIEALGDTVLAVKRAFPGAQVMRVRNKPIDWEKGDDIPF